VSQQNNPTDIDAAEPPSGSRRALLGKGAMAAAVAATAGLAVSRNASADDTDPVVIGKANNTSSGTTDTGLTGGSTLIVTAGKSNGFDVGAGIMPASIIGSQSIKGGFGLLGNYTNNTDAGVGVLAIAAKGTGVVARGPDADLEADGSGRLLLNRDAFAGAPPTGTSVVGTLARDNTGTLWYSPVAGTWVKLAAATSAGGAGTFHVIAPVRVYDSRLAVPSGSGKLATGQNRVVSIADARNETTGVVTTANVVPVGATAVVINLTVTETVGDLGGFLSVVPGDATALSGSSINWSGANQNIANGLTAKISADRKLNVFCGGIPAPAAHFVIDVSGYYI
jgi:hypothetical protein